MSFQENNGTIEMIINGTWDATKIKRCLDWIETLDRQHITAINLFVNRFPENVLLCSHFIIAFSHWFAHVEKRHFRFDTYPQEYYGLTPSLTKLSKESE